MLTDPYEYRVAGNKLLLAVWRRPSFIPRCVGVAGFDIHMDVLLETRNQPTAFDSIEAVLGAGMSCWAKMAKCDIAARLHVG